MCNIRCGGVVGRGEGACRMSIVRNADDAYKKCQSPIFSLCHMINLIKGQSHTSGYFFKPHVTNTHIALSNLKNYCATVSILGVPYLYGPKCKSKSLGTPPKSPCSFCIVSLLPHTFHKSSQNHLKGTVTYFVTFVFQK